MRQHGIGSFEIAGSASQTMTEGVYGDDEWEEEEVQEYKQLEKEYGATRSAKGASSSGNSSSSSSINNNNAGPLQHLIPSIQKVSEMLNNQGFDPLQWSESDVDPSKKVSVYFADSWAASILQCLEELTVRLDSQQSAVKDASLSSRKAEVSHDALQTRVKVLQDKLLEAERKLKAAEAKLTRVEEDVDRSSKSKRSDDGDSRRVVRGLEEKVQVCALSLSRAPCPETCKSFLIYRPPIHPIPLSP